MNKKGSLAEWSKALVLGTSPKGRGFESHSCQIIFCMHSGLNLKVKKKKKKMLLQVRLELTTPAYLFVLSISTVR